ncbi:MAG TPA: hypothetical protein VFS32_08115 [Candidatus Limnocylindrales bacterium]|nr:hypothetical protein [Candidatus Limnocylindrales bacterium]
MTTEGADDIATEAIRLGDDAVAAGIPLRLIGGLAIWATSPTARRPPIARSYPDVDLAADSRSVPAVRSFLEAHGYAPERLFNAIHGAQRLNFARNGGGWTIDVLLDELRMSHTIPFRGRLTTSGPTVDLADLLLMKLQVWEIERKDLADAAAVLVDHDLVRGRGTPSSEAVDLDRIAALTGADWGLGHTVERNLERVAVLASELASAPRPLAAQVEAVADAIEAAPKTLGWRARARVGERVRWYETPEEVRH